MALKVGMVYPGHREENELLEQMQEYMGMVCVCVNERPFERGDMDGLMNGWLKNGTLLAMLMD